MRYSEYIVSADWQNRCRRFLEVFEERCVACRTWGIGTIEIHHVSYARLGWESDEDLLPLCGPCHEEVHRHAKLMEARGWAPSKALITATRAKADGRGARRRRTLEDVALAELSERQWIEVRVREAEMDLGLAGDAKRYTAVDLEPPRPS